VESAVIEDRGREVRIFPDPKALNHAAADLFRSLAITAVSDGGRFTAALSGGSTPKGLYALLAEKPYRDQIAWDRVHLFLADERCVPMTHADSNFKLVHELLLSRVAIPKENAHRIRGEHGADRASADYEQVLRTFFSSEGYPSFDLVILGVGEDGHTASLFPGSPLLNERDRLAVPVFPGNQKQDRVTLTLPVLDHAKRVLFLATGTEKQNAVGNILAEGNSEGLPAGLVNPIAGISTWYLDQDAASRLSNPDNPAMAG
jgi:6-phosphogluconolactonase